ncbi:MAG: hypothetical protein JWR05_1400 [Mucilaginibacter sp.]|nr:hypothetical protein [Mucilaginibacter sp.]
MNNVIFRSHPLKVTACIFLRNNPFISLIVVSSLLRMYSLIKAALTLSFLFVFDLRCTSKEIKDLWDYSYRNRGRALNLLFHVLERKIGSNRNTKIIK